MANIRVWHTVNDVIVRAAWDGTFTLIDNANSFDVRNTLPFASVTDTMDLVIKLPLLINCTDTSDDFTLPEQTVPYASDVTDEVTVITKEPLLFSFIEDGITFDVTNALPFDPIQETLGFLIPQEVTDRALEGSDILRVTEEGDTRQTEIEL